MSGGAAEVEIALLAFDRGRVRAKPADERRIAIVVAGDPAQAARLVAMLQAAGYRVADAPADGAALAARLRAGPSDADPAQDGEETLSFAAYSAFFAALPMAVQRRVTARWGAAERDPWFRPGRLDCGRFAIPACRCGNVAVLVPPARRDPVPSHAVLAAYAWIADEFRADAAIDLDGAGRVAEGAGEAALFARLGGLSLRLAGS